MVSLIQIGTIAAPLITAEADRFGRRRLLMLTIIGYTIFTGITALAWNGFTFALFRFWRDGVLVRGGVDRFGDAC